MRQCHRARCVLTCIKKSQEKFRLLREFEFVIPTKYKADTALDLFVGKNSARFCDVHSAMKSINFECLAKLVPRKRYLAKMFEALDFVSAKDCWELCERKKALLVGPNGLTLVFGLKERKFPVGRDVFCLSEMREFWQDCEGIPRGISIRRQERFPTGAKENFTVLSPPKIAMTLLRFHRSFVFNPKFVILCISETEE